MQEKYDRKATIKGVSIAIMEAVINYLYTGDISLNDNNVYDFLDTAEYLQIPGKVFHQLDIINYALFQAF